MTMNRALHSKDDRDILYVSRKEEGRGLTSIQDNVDASIQRLEDDVKKRGGTLITAIRLDTNNTSINRRENNKKKKQKTK